MLVCHWLAKVSRVGTCQLVDLPAVMRNEGAPKVRLGAKGFSLERNPVTIRSPYQNGHTNVPTVRALQKLSLADPRSAFTAT